MINLNWPLDKINFLISQPKISAKFMLWVLIKDEHTLRVHIVKINNYVDISSNEISSQP